MYLHKIVRMFTLHEPLRFNQWKELISNYTLPDKKTLGINYVGWDKDADLGIHFSSSAKPFHISEYSGYFANVPKDVFSRHLEHAISLLDYEPSDDQRRNIESELFVNLQNSIPHEKFQLYLIFFESGTVWMCSTSASVDSQLLRSIRATLQRSGNDWDAIKHPINSTAGKALIKGEISHLTVSSCVSFGVGKRLVTLDSGFTDPTYFNSMMDDEPLARITVSAPQDESLEVTITMDGNISKVEVTDEFKKQWKTVGDPKHSDELWSVAAGIWVDSLTQVVTLCSKVGEDCAEQHQLADEKIWVGAD